MSEPIATVTARRVATDALGFVARALAIAVLSAVGFAAVTLLLA